VVTPKIVSDTAQARQVTEELKRKLPSLEGLLPKLPTTPPPAGTFQVAPATAPPAVPPAPKTGAEMPAVRP
jgi:hypothetical protein